MFTGYGWTARLLLKDRVRVSYALNGARDHPEMEGFISRFKNENKSLLQDAQTLEDLQAVVGASQFRCPESVQEMGCTSAG